MLKELVGGGFLVIYSIVNTSAATAASFSCANASTLVEQAICSDRNLSVLDEDLAQAYRRVLLNSSDAGTVKADQQSWLTNVRNKCSNVQCLRTAYSDRLAALEVTHTKRTAATESVRPASMERSESSSTVPQRGSRPGNSAPSFSRENLKTDAGRAAYDECMKGNSGSAAMERCGWSASQNDRWALQAAAKAADKAKSDERYTQDMAEWNKKQSEKQLAARLLESCEQQNQHAVRLHKASDTVLEMLHAIRINQGILDADKEKERATGLIDVQGRSEAYEAVKLMKDSLPQAFDDYKAAGGSASTPDTVRAASDPCVSLRPNES
jgi:uncharacterized protein